MGINFVQGYIKGEGKSMNVLDELDRPTISLAIVLSEMKIQDFTRFPIKAIIKYLETMMGK